MTILKRSPYQITAVKAMIGQTPLYGALKSIINKERTSMLYFKHYSTMRNDLKIRKLINRYGLEGYGLYNLIVESITDSICDESPEPELPENCSDIAELYNGNTEKINEIVSYMINLGLLEISEITQRISCEKAYKYIEKSATRSPRVRRLCDLYKQKYNSVHFVPDNPKHLKTNVIEEEIEVEEEVEKKEKDPLLSVKTEEENIDPITNNSFSLITYMYDRIEEEHNKLTPQDPYKRNEDFFIRKLFDTIDKETFDRKLSALITRIKNTKNKEFMLALTAKTLLNKLNELQIVAEPPKVNNRFKSGNVRPATRSLTLREQILSTPGLADKYCLADVYEDEEERGINSAECIKLECYNEV